MKHILIMEDNMQLALEWRDAFELNGDNVVLCFNGEDAISHLKDLRFDVIVLDMFIDGGKGGLHVIASMRGMRDKAPAIIAVTGAISGAYMTDSSNLFLTQAKNLGASATIQKPFLAAELVLAAHSI